MLVFVAVEEWLGVRLVAGIMCCYFTMPHAQSYLTKQLSLFIAMCLTGFGTGFHVVFTSVSKLLALFLLLFRASDFQ